MISIPDLESEITISSPNSIGAFKPGSTTQFVALPPSEEEAVLSRFEGKIRDYLSSVSSVQVSDKSLAESSGFTYVAPGHTFSQPTPVYSDVNVKEGSSFEDFEKRKRSGEIMMSDYDRSVIRVRQYPGICSSTPITRRRSILTLSRMVEAGIVSLHEMNYSGKIYYTYIFEGYPFRRNIRDIYVDRTSIASYGRGEFSEPLWIYPPKLEAQTIYDAARVEILPYESLVTNTVAKANTDSVDVLTSFAELPKSIASVMQGFKLLAGILRDAKKREFDLNKAYKYRNKLLTDRYKKRIFRLDRELNSKNLSPKRRKALQEHRDSIYVGHKDALIRSADELASETASVWLNYRYNIMPNVYLAQDVFDAVNRFSRQFVTAKGTSRNRSSLDIGPYRISMSTSLRCTIKRRFTAASAAAGESVISNDIFVTAWELVPLSFVYDWFINAGDLLAAQSYKKGWESEKATLANSFNFDSVSYDSNYDACLIKPRTVVSGFYYKRRVINPVDYCGLVWQPSVGLERQIDAAALIWPSVRSLLLQGKTR